MAESYGELTVADVCDAVERFTGDTTSGAALVHVKAGYSRFLAGIDPRNMRSHFWSFLQPIGTVGLTVVGAGTYDLAADFGGLITPFIYQPAAGVVTRQLETVSPETIFEAWRTNTNAGLPNIYAILPNTSGAWQLIVAPIPAAAYTLKYRYLKLAADITDSTGKFTGGPLHSYTIRQLALAEAELATGHVAGTHEQRAAAMLITSIDRDKQLFTTDDIERIF